MRVDFKIALILALAALPAGAALMVAPEYLHLSGIIVPLTFWGGIVLSVVLILIAGIIALRAEREAPTGRWGFKVMWPQYLMTVCGVGFFVGLIAFLQLNVSTPIREVSEDRPTAPPATMQPVAGILIDFSSGILPPAAPSDGVIHIFEIRDLEDTPPIGGPDKDGVEVQPIEYHFRPNQEIDWKKTFEDLPVPVASKCEVTSTTDTPVYDVTIKLRLPFHPMIPHIMGEQVPVGTLVQAFIGKSSAKSGPVVFVKESKFTIGKVYPQIPYVIYFVNRTRYLVKIELPENATTQDYSKPVNESEQKIKLSRGRMLSAYMAASKPPKFLQEPPLQAPWPPSTPERR